MAKPLGASSSVRAGQTEGNAMDVHIRQATSEDIDALVTLSRRTISACYPRFLGAETVEAYIKSGALERYVRDNVERCLVLVRADKVLGYSVTKEDLIDLMMVDVGAHRRGLGTALLHHVENMLLRTYETVRLESFAGNAAANAFYHINGWLEARRFTDEPPGAEKIELRKSKPT